MEYLEFGLRTLETAAARLDSLEKSEPAETSELSTIMTEYYILRVYLVRFLTRLQVYYG